jgi:hypothetical protein
MSLSARVTLCRLAVVAGILSLCGCTDAATRVAYDLEWGAGRLGSREGARRDVSHVPRRWPEGCAGSYTLRLDRGSAIALGHNNFRNTEGSGGLHVRCFAADGNPHSWGTTYHLRFVDVPVPVEMDKKGGETAVIELQRINGRAVVVGAR